MKIDSWLEFGLSLMGKSRKIIRNRKKDLNVSYKSDKSVVTDIDKQIEDSFRKEIGKRFPRHGIVGEEFGNENQQADFQWYIDPIDGTISFINDIPLYGTILALYKKGEPVFGIIDIPAIDRCYYAGRGTGAFCNGEIITISDLRQGDSIETEIIATGDRKQFAGAGFIKAFDSLLSKHPIVRTIPDCFGHALALNGSVGAMVDIAINKWDFAATNILVKEAGGNLLISRMGKINNTSKYNIIFGKPTVVRWLNKTFSFKKSKAF